MFKKYVVHKYITKHLNTTFKDLEYMKRRKIHVKISPYTELDDGSFQQGCIEIFRNKPITMTISKLAFDEDQVEEIVVHELCHLAVYCYYGVEEDEHGTEFQKYLKMAETVTGLNLRTDIY